MHIPNPTKTLIRTKKKMYNFIITISRHAKNLKQHEIIAPTINKKIFTNALSNKINNQIIFFFTFKTKYFIEKKY